MSEVVINVEHLWKKYKKGNLSPKSFFGRFTANYKISHKLSYSKPFLQGEDFYALSEVSFMIEKGVSLGIIGNNGAGKSTLLKILSRITSPTAGKVYIKGKIASLLEVGTGFHQDLTGRENIYLNGTILGMSKAEIKSKFDEIVDFSGISDFLDTPVKRYSSGMYVRLAFSVAAHLNADILLMDEVLAVGDSEFQKKCLGKMDSVVQEGRTIVFVSHNLDSIQKLCNQSLLLEKGKIVIKDSSSAVINMYLGDINNNAYYYSFDPLPNSVSINSIHLKDESGIGTNIFLWEQKPSFTFHISVRKIEISAVIGFGIVNRFGNRVFTNEKYLIELIDMTGDYHIKVEVPSHLLAPGKYSLVFAIHIPNQIVIDKLSEKVSFYVQNIDSEQYKYNSDEGSIIVPCDWEITNI
ncbi:MAG: ABC transporter ATP-binding protein [Bacteroidales bacterium]